MTPWWIRSGILAVIGGASLTVLAMLLFYRCDSPELLTATASLQHFVVDIVAFEDWSQRSINYTAGIPRGGYFPTVAVAGLWVFLTSLLQLMLSAPRLPRKQLACFFLVGWCALDIRWGWDMAQRLPWAEMRDLFSGAAQKPFISTEDRIISAFVQEMRAHLPKLPVRLWIIHAEPTGFVAGRTRYHLLPHNSWSVPQLPPPEKVHNSDYLLLMPPLQGIRYDRAHQQLWQNTVMIPATPVHAANGGVLLRVEKEQ